jgi:hypothetical protein
MRTLRRLGWVLVLALSMAACGEADTGATELRLADLVHFQERYDGDVVSTTGMVNMFDEPEHYWVEDEALNRVRIVPHDAVSDLVGQRVRVVGRFEYGSGEGRVISARSVRPVD